MQFLWVGFLSLLAVGLVRRHGREYVPLVVLIAGARLYAEARHHSGLLVDGLVLASATVLWVVARMTGERASDA